MVGIANFRFPIADLVKGQSKIGNRQSAMKKSRAKQRGTSIRLKCFGSCFTNSPSCLAVCFTWPQVALTHHVFSGVYTPSPSALSTMSIAGALMQFEVPQARAKIGVLRRQ
jgi:hypothetical protein